MKYKEEYKKMLELFNESKVNSKYEYLSKLQIYTDITSEFTISNAKYTDKEIEKICDIIYDCYINIDNASINKLTNIVTDEMAILDGKIIIDYKTIEEYYKDEYIEEF